jgi:hypothetical protein
MSIPKHTMSRRTFLRSMFAQSVTMVVSSFQLSHPTRMSSVLATLPSGAYGSGAYGRGRYGGRSHRLYLPLLNKED